MSQKYEKLGDEQATESKPQDVYSANNSARGTIINKESYLSEESQQSSAMSLELRQKVNDQFQRKKMEFYKMYNKNPKEYREERGRRAGRGNKVGYGIQEGAAAEYPDEGQDELPEVDQYSDYYEEEDEGAGKQSKPEKKKKEQKSAEKNDKKDRKSFEKDQMKKAKQDDAQRKKDEKDAQGAEKKAEKDKLDQEKKEEKDRLDQEKKEEQERLRQQKEAEKNMNEEQKQQYREKLAKEKEERLKKKEEEKQKKQQEKEKSAAEKQAEKDKKAKEKQEASEFNAQKRQEQREKQNRDKSESMRKKSEQKEKGAQEKEVEKQRKADEKAQKEAENKVQKDKDAEQRKQERSKIAEEKKKELEEKQAKQDEIRAKKQAEKDAAEAQKQAQQDSAEADKVADEEAKAEEQAAEQEFKQEDAKEAQKDKQEIEELKKKNDQEGIKKKKEEMKQREEQKKQDRVEKKKQQKEQREQKKQKRKEEIKEKKKQEYEKKMVAVRLQREQQETKEREIRKRQNERKAQEIANKKVKGDDQDFADDGDLKEIEGLSQMEDKLSPEDQKRSDKFCSKFCWMLWLSVPSMIQVGTLFAQEIINQYIVGRTGDYTFLDTLAMSNFLIYLGVYGTAIAFNSTLETLVPHAVATNKFEVAGHLLNRAIFLWMFFFGLLFAGIYFIDEILVQGLEWDEEEARSIQEYMVFASPALFLWGFMDAHRRLLNGFQRFWTPVFTMGIAVALHPFTCQYFLVDEQMGLQGLAIAQAITNFGSFFFMRVIANCGPQTRQALFFPRCKTCANLGQYLAFGIPQLIMFWIDTWQWQLMAFAAGWFGMVQQYTTIALLTFLLICMLPGISMASTSASLVGSKIGCANVTSAQYYFRSAFLVQLIVCIGECIALSVFMTLCLERLTESKDLLAQLESVYPLFILNVFLDSMRAMMKGVLRGVGIQNSVLPYHILLQGMVLPGVMYAFAFNLCEDDPSFGIWIAMSIVDSLLLIAYWGRLVTTDWHEISIKVIKRTNKIAGQLQDEEELLKKPGNSEVV